MSKILVVDDESMFLGILKKELENRGYRVTAEFDSEKALKILEQESFDFVILDINMPNKTGYELLQEVRRNKCDSNVILITAFASIEGAVKGMKMGADDYLPKPFDIKILLDKIGQLSNPKNRIENLSGAKKKNLTELSPSNNRLMTRIENIIKRVKDTKATVLITGENGTGKGVAAKTIHYTSNRAEKPFMLVDCASLPESLIESELFGYEKGAFTGANDIQKGKFELADSGTIFLDEIGALPLRLQPKLLTVLQERAFFRLGGAKRIKVNARIIAATNENLEDSVKAGKFREDLYYRLNVVRIEMPPLRFRKEDIIPLAKDILQRQAEMQDIMLPDIEDGFFNLLLAYDWPGNLRELENALESALILCDKKILKKLDLPLRISSNEQRYSNNFEVGTNESIKNVTKNSEILAIILALEQCNHNREDTAKLLGISRRTLQYKLKKYDLLQHRDDS